MQQRLVAESKEERATRLENVQPDQHLPPFHQEMSTIDTPTCSTCMEKFPGMKVNGHLQTDFCTLKIWFVHTFLNTMHIK